MNTKVIWYNIDTCRYKYIYMHILHFYLGVYLEAVAHIIEIMCKLKNLK